MATEKTFDVEVVFASQDFPGTFRAGKFWKVGSTKETVTESQLTALKGDARLAVVVIPAAVVVQAAPPASSNQGGGYSKSK